MIIAIREALKGLPERRKDELPDKGPVSADAAAGNEKL